jgi:Helix-turn-helix domain
MLNQNSLHIAQLSAILVSAVVKQRLTLKGITEMKFINPETKTFKVFSALQEGKALTASQAAKMGVKNLSAEVSRIRSHGFAVYTNSRKAGNGVQVTEYVLGKPSRKLVAAGYRALALGI